MLLSAPSPNLWKWHALQAVHVSLSIRVPRVRFVRAYYPELPPQAFVHYGNFIGETLKLADSLNVPRITLGVMIGKAVKLAEGHLDTHSRQVTMNRNFIISMAREAGCGEDVCTRIDAHASTASLWLVNCGTLYQPRFCQPLRRPSLTTATTTVPLSCLMAN